MLKLSFKQTKAEFMVRIASTLLFNKLSTTNSQILSVREITESIQYGYTEKASKSEIGPKFVRITDLKDGQVFWESVPFCQCENPEQYLLKQNDLLFARTGATTGKTHLFRETPPIAVFASYLIRVRPMKEINPEYLYFFFQSDLYWSQISSQKEGSAQPNVNGQKLSDIVLPIADEETQRAICKFLAAVRTRQDGFAQELPELPHPLDEQRRIVERVESITANIAKAQSLREEANGVVEVLMKSERHKVFSSLDLEKFGKPLSEVAKFLDGKRIPLNKHQREEKKPGKIPYYGASGIVDYIDEWIFDDTLLLISEDGANIEMRNKPIAFVITGKTWVNNHSHVLKFDNDITAYYLVHYVEHSDVKPLWRGATRPKINKAALEKFIVPIPPLDEQRRIVAYLDSVQARLASLRELQSQTGEELSALLPSVLDRAFRGEL